MKNIVKFVACVLRVVVALFVMKLLVSGVGTLNGAEGRHSSETNVVFANNNIKAHLEVVKDSDDGVYALIVALRNISKTNDIVIKVLDTPEQIILVNVHLYGGRTIARREVTRKAFELHSFDFRLNRGEEIKWFVRLQDRLLPRDQIPERAEANISALVSVRYYPVNSDASKAEFAVALASMQQLGVVITRKALEGDAGEKYDKTLSPDQRAAFNTKK